MDLHAQIRAMGDRALAAAHRLAEASTRRKNSALLAMADALLRDQSAIQAANREDIEAAAAAGLSDAMVDRLTLTDARFAAMVQGLRDVAALPDPVGKVLGRVKRPNGLVIVKRRVPLGVIAILYESRPNVTADAAALCLKSSNAVILRGGKEAIRSNLAIAASLSSALAGTGIPADAVQLVPVTDRDAVRELVQMDDRVDVVIPRGGESLIRAVMEQARVPVLKHYKGVCHIFVEKSADLGTALAIVENAKCQRPGTCNAVETLLVDEAIAGAFLPMLAGMAARRNVEIRADAAARAIVPAFAPASPGDWDAEYLDFILAVRVVGTLRAAIEHINRHGSRHSDAIVTTNPRAARAFLKRVDSAAVYVNASTRFTDGAEFGLGAEMGISTDKLHARGPVGLAELTTYKYEVTGDGQLRG
ncbi:MAG: glutamate-5-semialdehyde dehydrogenase [Kiritimatiellia bacterium]|jgi:glutamate-5-semialdehyde dehydrogenase